MPNSETLNTSKYFKTSLDSGNKNRSCPGESGTCGRPILLYKYKFTNSKLKRNKSAKYKLYFFNRKVPPVSLDFTWKQQIEVFHHYNQKSQEYLA
jgi:hypothetical protein